MQNEFINLAAHELKTPTQPILSLSEVLLQKRGNIEEYREALEIINKSARRLKRLTENIFDATRIGSHTLALKREQFNINDVVKDILRDFGSQVGKDNRSKNLTFESKEDNILVMADKKRISQVISNLVDNAIKYTNSEGSVSITSEIGDDQAIVTVRDNGNGIDSEIMPRLFSKFASNSFAGTGLGLYISKNFVEAHGGKIWATNNYNGKGATFAFSIPTIREEEHIRNNKQTNKQLTDKQ
jgi:signal transduction histidine kinase